MLFFSPHKVQEHGGSGRRERNFPNTENVILCLQNFKQKTFKDDIYSEK